MKSCAIMTLIVITTMMSAPSDANGEEPAHADQKSLPAIDLATQPTLFVVGYAHLDTQWRWCYPTSIREYLANTLHDNFKLMDKYPHYVFNFSGSRRYQFMKEYYPAEYEQLKKYIAAGKWFPCGSSVDENDANVPSAESLIRQVLYGNRYFQREFGKSSEEYMLPDCFGFPAALPSVLAHCGIKGFSTQKLTWGSPVGIPFKVGVWEGPDGRSVIAALDPGAYVGEVRDDLSTNDSWITRVNNNGKASGVFGDYHYYGTGDMGGAPTEQSVQMIEKSVTGTGPLKVISGPADWLFKSITPAMAEKLPRYKGELLLTEHSAGSITSQSYMKRWNRKNELLADAAEKAATAAWWLGAEYPADRLERAWYLLLGSQMHDILPGTSHPKAYEYSWNDEVLAGNQFAAVLTDAVGAVSSAMDTQSKGRAVIVFNPLSIEREDVVEFGVPWDGEKPNVVYVVSPDGHVNLSQVLGLNDGTLNIAALVRVPPVGFAVLDVRDTFDGNPLETLYTPNLRINDRSLENDRYLVKLNDAGDVSSIYDKSARKELLSPAGCARLAMMYEKPAQWPAWNMDWKDRQQPPRSYVVGPTAIRIVENGPVRVALEVTREHEGSKFVQTVRLARGVAGNHVEFDNVIDWTTRERSLKAEFPLAVSNPKATYDIQVGAIERDNNSAKRYENPSHLWFDLTDVKGDYGVTIANDSKFGSDKPNDNTLRLTLLYTPGVSGDYQDQGTQDIGRHHILYAIAGHQGDWRANDAGSPWMAARLNQPLRAFVVPSHPGALGKTISLLECDNPNVMVTAVKKSEDGDQVIVRLRELTGQGAESVRISMPRPIVEANEVDGQERRIGAGNIVNGELVADVHGYGLRAFAFKLGERPAKVAPPVFQSLDLPFDTDVVSANAKRNDGAIDADGRTYPAEQLGSSITCNSVVFNLGSVAEGQSNAVWCKGQTLALSGGGGGGPGKMDFNRLELLAASSEGDQRVSFITDATIHDVTVPCWRGFIGQWDNRVWIGKVPEVAFNWSATFGGLEPGYIKPTEVAWFCTHHHSPRGDQPYEYCYLYKISLDLPKGARKLTLPDNQKVMLLSATLVNDSRDQAKPANVLFDVLDDREQDAPRILPGEGTFADATEVRIEPRLYGRADSICYTIDGSTPGITSPKIAGAIVVDQPTTVRAAVLGRDGRLGPEARAQINVNDTTSPRVMAAEALFNQPTISIQFSEPLDKGSAVTIANYTFESKINVRSAALDESLRRVTLTLDSPMEPGKTSILRIRGVKDRSPAHNTLSNAQVPIAAPAPVFHLAEVKPEQRGQPINVEKLPVKEGDAWTLNMFVRAAKQPANRTIIAGFGACGNNGDATGRYLCKFANGIHFWSHHSDLAPDGDKPLDLNRWQMLTSTYDGRVLRLYKDGALIGEREAHLAADEPVVNICPPDPWEKKRTFDGEIREMTIWNAALTEEALRMLQTAARMP